MFVRLLSAQGDANAGDYETMAQLISERVIPTVQREPGFRAAYYLLDRENNKLTSVTFYDTEADVRAGMESIKSLREQALSALKLRPVANETYEVIASAGSL
jgi:heme-degrading monooxygenase HmoA